MRKRLLFLILILTLAFGSLAGTVSAAIMPQEDQQSAITWELRGSVLVISGSGDMGDYETVKAPWAGQNGSVTSVTVQPGITRIGAGAFSGFEALTSVSIPSTVTAIGARAFYDCGELTEAVLPSGVSSVGDFAFSGCVNLQSLSLPNTLTKIGQEAFSRCVSLDAVRLPDSLTSLGTGAFSGCTAMSELVISSSLRTISSSAFADCKSLSRVTVPDSVSTIGSRAFSGCGSLVSVTLGSGLTSIGGDAFGGCGFLSDVVFQGKAPSIAAGAFTGVMATCYYPAQVPSWNETAMGNYGGSLIWSPMAHSHKYSESVTKPDCVNQGFQELTCACGDSHREMIPALGHDWQDATVDAPKTCARCGETQGEPLSTVLGKGNCGDGVSWTLTVDGTMTIVGSGPMKDYSGTAVPWAKLSDQITSVAVADGVESVGSGAFSGCRKLVSVFLSDSIRKIGPSAFSGCTDLGFVWMTQELEYIGNSAFSGCKSLREIEIPQEVTFVGRDAFSGCASLRRVSFGGTQDQWNALIPGTGLESVPVELGGERIPGDADGDGEVTYLDAMRVLRAATGLEPLSGEIQFLCDMDADGKLTYLDAMRILRLSVGL